MENLNWRKTKATVEDIIHKYIFFCLSVDYYSTSEISDDYVIIEMEKEDEKYTQYFENSSITKEERLKRIRFINYFRFSFNKLTEEERKMLYWTYLDKNNDYDDRFIANSLGFSLGYYYVRKKETLIRFAYALGVEVYIK